MADKPLYIFKETPSDMQKFYKYFKINLLNISEYNKLDQYEIGIEQANEKTVEIFVKMVKKGKTRFRTKLIQKEFQGFEALFSESKIEKKGGIMKMMVQNLIGQLKVEIKRAIEATLEDLK